MEVCLCVNVTEVQTTVVLVLIYLEISDTASISGFNLKDSDRRQCPRDRSLT